MHVSLLRAFGLILFTLCWLAYDHYRPWINFHAEAMALFAIGLLALSRALERKPAVMAAPHVSVLVFALSFLPWLQYAMGSTPFAGDALLASLYLCGLAAAIWVGYSYSAVNEGSAGAGTLFCCFWIAAMASAAIGLLQWLDLQAVFGMYLVQTEFGDRAMGNFGQPNQLATFLLMGLCALAWSYEKKQIGPAGFSVGAVFLLWVLTLSQSRSGSISAVLVLLFLTWKNFRGRERIHSMVFPALLATWLCMVWVLPAVHEWLLMGGTSTKSMTTDNARITIWSQVLAGIAEAPWTGYGWNGTPTAHAEGGLKFPGSLTYTNAHNVVLDILAWTGIPLGVLITVLLGYWFVSRMWKVSGSHAIYAFAALIPVALHSMVEYPFAYAYFLVASGLLVGIVESDMQPRLFTLSRSLVCAVAIAGLLGGVYMVREYILIEEDFRVVRFENLRVGQTPAEYEVPEIHVLSQLGTMLKASRLRARPGMSGQELEDLRMSSRRFAYGGLHMRYALALGLNGDPAGASRQMAIIRGMYGDFYYRAAVGVLREEQEKYPELGKVVVP